jgi:hypothetical protein
MTAEQREVAAEIAAGPRGEVRGPFIALIHLVNRRSARLAARTDTPPVIAEAPALSGDHGRGLNKDQGLPPSRPVTQEPRPEEAVRGANLRPPHRSAVDGQLMSQSDDLDLQRESRPE